MVQEDRPIQPAAAESEAASAFALDLHDEIDALHRTDAWSRGKAAKRLNSSANFRVSLMVLAAGSSLGEHHNPGRVSIQTITGHVTVRAGAKSFDLPLGRIVFIDPNVRHDVEAIDESAFLVTMSLETPAAQ